MLTLFGHVSNVGEPCPALRNLPPMHEQQPYRSLLEEIDARQDQLLDDLEALEKKIEEALDQWMNLRAPTPVPVPVPVPAPVSKAA